MEEEQRFLKIVVCSGENLPGDENLHSFVQVTYNGAVGCTNYIQKGGCNAKYNSRFLFPHQQGEHVIFEVIDQKAQKVICGGGLTIPENLTFLDERNEKIKLKPQGNLLIKTELMTQKINIFTKITMLIYKGFDFTLDKMPKDAVVRVTLSDSETNETSSAEKSQDDSELIWNSVLQLNYSNESQLVIELFDRETSTILGSACLDLWALNETKLLDGNVPIANSSNCVLGYIRMKLSLWNADTNSPITIVPSKNKSLLSPHSAHLHKNPNLSISYVEKAFLSSAVSPENSTRAIPNVYVFDDTDHITLKLNNIPIQTARRLMFANLTLLKNIVIIAKASLDSAAFKCAHMYEMNSSNGTSVHQSISLEAFGILQEMMSLTEKIDNQCHDYIERYNLASPLKQDTHRKSTFEQCCRDLEAQEMLVFQHGQKITTLYEKFANYPLHARKSTIKPSLKLNWRSSLSSNYSRNRAKRTDTASTAENRDDKALGDQSGHQLSQVVRTIQMWTLGCSMDAATFHDTCLVDPGIICPDSNPLMKCCCVGSID